MKYMFEYHMLCKIFPYSIYGDAFSWISQLQPGSLTSWEDTERTFFYKFLDEAEATREREKNDKWDRMVESWQVMREYQIPRQLFDYIMAERDEYHGSGEPSRVDEAGTGDPTSASIDSTSSVSIKSMTSTSINTTTSPSINTMTSSSINTTTSPSIDITISTSIDRNSYCRLTPIEILESSSCPQDIADSTLESTCESSCYPALDVAKEITMEDFLEIEEFLELEDGETLEYFDSDREVTMEDFLELEEWLDSEQKLDDERNNMRKDLETLSKARIS